MNNTIPKSITAGATVIFRDTSGCTTSGFIVEAVKTERIPEYRRHYTNYVISQDTTQFTIGVQTHEGSLYYLDGHDYGKTWRLYRKEF